MIITNMIYHSCLTCTHTQTHKQTHATHTHLQRKVWYSPQVYSPAVWDPDGGQVRETPFTEEGRDQEGGGDLPQGDRPLSLPDGVP